MNSTHDNDGLELDRLSHGLWARSAPAAPVTEPLAEAIETDVAVVGAGYTGLSAALHLTEAGVRVVVLEAAAIGFGGSGRNVGLVNAGLWLAPAEIVRLLGEQRGEGLLSLLGAAPDLVFDLIARHGIDCQAVRNGTLHCAVGETGRRDIERRAEAWSARGAPVQLMTRGEAAGAIGSDAYAGALLDRRAGTIHPLAYARGLARAACAGGALLFTRSAVRTITRDGDRWLLRTEQGQVASHWVIVATNAYSRGPWRKLAGELVPLPYFQVATRPLGDNLRRSILPERQGAWDTLSVLSSFRLDREGRLIFGSIGALHGAAATIHRAWAKRALKRLFPQLGDIELEDAWYGTIGMTGDGLPRFHRLGPQMLSFSGYNGRGIGTGTALGRHLAGLVHGRLDEAALPAQSVRTAGWRGAKAAAYHLGSQAYHLIKDRM